MVTPSGEQRNITSTTTGGIQEAIDYACEKGFDLYISGGDEDTGGATVYDCGSTPIVFPPMQGKRVATGAITLNFSGAIGMAPGIRFDSCMMVDVEFSAAQIVYAGEGAAIEFKPVNQLPLDPLAAIIDSRFFFTTVVSPTGTSLVKFSTYSGDITSCEFNFVELNGAETGVLVHQGSRPFQSNSLRCPHVHGQSETCVSLGDSVDFADNVRDNSLEVFAFPPDGVTAFDVYGSENKVCGHSRAPDGATPAHGVRFRAPAASNECDFQHLDGGILDESTAATNRVEELGPKSHSTVTVGDSPFVYQNLDAKIERVTVQGGSVTGNLLMSLDGATYYDLGLPAGMFTLYPGEYLKIVHAGAPTMRKFQ
jgi:hypothetical protein